MTEIAGVKVTRAEENLYGEWAALVRKLGDTLGSAEQVRGLIEQALENSRHADEHASIEARRRWGAQSMSPHTVFCERVWSEIVALEQAAREQFTTLAGECLERERALRAGIDSLPDVRGAYPYEEGDTVVIGPECFATLSGDVLSWRGTNYVPQEDRPALTEENLVRAMVANGGPADEHVLIVAPDLKLKAMRLEVGMVRVDQGFAPGTWELVPKVEWRRRAGDTAGSVV